jgi:hypothetical protein
MACPSTCSNEGDKEVCIIWLMLNLVFLSTLIVLMPPGHEFLATEFDICADHLQ